MFTPEGLVSLVVTILVVGLAFGLLWWLINYLAGEFPGMAPFVKIARVVLMIGAVLICIAALLSFAQGRPWFQI